MLSEIPQQLFFIHNSPNADFNKKYQWWQMETSIVLSELSNHSLVYKLMYVL